MHCFLRTLIRSAPALASALVLLVSQLVSAQSSSLPTGKIAGRIVDASTGAGLSDVGVQLVGTTLGTMSGFEGRYTLPNVPAGTVTIQVRRIGYTPKTVTGILLEAGTALEQNISLQPATVQLAVQIVTASAERGTVSEALDQQRNAPGIVNSVTAEQIAKSPDGDAAQAVQRVSGVTVQDGKTVFVRGLGDRYTTTSLNGARLPSPDPEKRVVPFDLFPSGLLQSITTSKTFTPDLPGDFSGAHVDIQTREFPASRQTTYAMAVGFNDAASGSTVVTAPSAGGEWLGFTGARRLLPSAVASAGDFRGASQTDVNAAVGSFRNAWSARQATGSPNGSFSASVGGSDPIFGREIGYVASASYAHSQEVREHEQRALAEGIGTNFETSPLNEYRGSTGRQSVLWGGLLNFSTLVGQRSRIAINNTYTRTADNEARYLEGYDLTDNLEVKRTQLRYVTRAIRSSQLLGEHEVGSGNRLDWAVTASGVSRSEPDRADLGYGRLRGAGPEVPFTWLAGGPDGAQRTFGDLHETGYAANLNYAHSIGAGAYAPVRLKAGLSFRSTHRDANNTSYSLTASGISAEDQLLSAEEIFDGRFSGTDDDHFSVQTLASGGSYTADDRVIAGYGMGEFLIGSRLKIIGGARIETTDLDVNTLLLDGPPVSAVRRDTDVLPSLILNVKVTEAQSVRFSASQTLARPEYRELSEVVNYNALTGIAFYGNAELERTLIQNYDARWEWYPNRDEVLSVALFAKRFDAPIEQVEVTTSGTSQYTFVNARSADNIGIELEARKDLGMLGTWFEPMTLFANTTFIRSEIDPGVALGSASTRKRPMVGQAPYVVNAGLTYASMTRGSSATILYNVVGKRITTVGPDQLPDVYEQPRQSLDVSLRVPVMRGLSAKLDAKNLFDSETLLKQGSVVREGYRSGRVFTLGLSLRPE
jgi:hypothetical protein